MKYYSYLLIVVLFISSCKENDTSPPNFPDNYGHGLYIATDNGVSFYKDGELQNQIFKEVNGIELIDVERIKIDDKKAYIAAKTSLYAADINSFGMLGEASGFKGIVDFDFVFMDRIFAVDKKDSRVKVVDMDLMEIISDVEMGDSTKPTFIVTKSYRSFVMNGGEESELLKDSTIIAIDHRYGDNVPSADFMGSLYVGENPNSAVNDNDILVLCKGVYDTDNMSDNTSSSLVRFKPYGEIEVEWSQQLPVYNANNLTFDLSDPQILSFTAAGGVYTMSKDGNGVQPILQDFDSDILYYQDEEYSIYNPLDSTTSYYNRDVLYVNDAENNSNIIYKYNLTESEYMDTIILEANVNDVIYY